MSLMSDFDRHLFRLSVGLNMESWEFLEFSPTGFTEVFPYVSTPIFVYLSNVYFIRQSRGLEKGLSHVVY